MPTRCSFNILFMWIVEISCHDAVFHKKIFTQFFLTKFTLVKFQVFIGRTISSRACWNFTSCFLYMKIKSRRSIWDSSSCHDCKGEKLWRRNWDHVSPSQASTVTNTGIDCILPLTGFQKTCLASTPGSLTWPFFCHQNAEISPSCAEGL